ncbi:MAG: TonB C-terminal domain-containing protein [Elusimicrobia bacterium]|nr:TonB C-terminal domain-containing protein [Elusimicrobiota bacterium]
MELAPSTLKPYLLGSFGAHAALLAAALGALPSANQSRSQIYTIDFVGPTASIINTQGSAPASSAAPTLANPRQAPQTDVDEFGRRRRKPFVLPRPSLLRGFREKPAPQPSVNDAAPAPVPGASPGGEAGAGGADVATDMPNFPYPWYISQVRANLWNQWSARMPRLQGESVVVFTVLPNGALVDLRIETSSGDSAFDLAALSAVQDAAPFPPLPRGFQEPFLKIHVTLKAL